MTADLPEPFEALTFLSPMSPDRARRLAEFAGGVRDGGVVLDLGCGWAELLLRTLEVSPQARGVGVDDDERYVRHGRELARRRGLDDRVQLVVHDASTYAAGRVDAVICVGASQIWARPGDALAPVDYAAALTAVRAHLPRGGRVVYGEGIWSSTPTTRATQALGGGPDELVTLPALVETAVASGFAPVSVEQASLAEWDAFESGFAAGRAWWLARHPADHPDAAEVRADVAQRWAGYLDGYRDVMGMGYLQLVAV